MAEKQEAFNTLLESLKSGTLKKSAAKKGNSVRLEIKQRFGKLTARDITQLFDAIAEQGYIIGLDFRGTTFEGTAFSQMVEEVRKNTTLIKLYVDPHMQEQHAKDWAEIQKHANLNKVVRRVRKNLLYKLPAPYSCDITYKTAVLNVSQANLSYTDLKRIVEAIPKNTRITRVVFPAVAQGGGEQKTPTHKLTHENLEDLQRRFKRKMKGKQKSLVFERRRDNNIELDSDQEHNTAQEKPEPATEETGANMGGQNLTALYKARSSVKVRKDTSKSNIGKSRTVAAQKPKSILRNNDERRVKSGY